jgi:hypothetical protein
MEFSELTNKELKGILRENQVKNYSNLNKKELVKKVNNLIKVQNGGKSGKGKNGKKKKYKLKDLIGAGPPAPPSPSPSPAIPAAPNYNISNSSTINYSLLNSNIPRSNSATAPLKNSETSNVQAVTAPLKNSATLNARAATATAPAFSKNEIKRLENNEEARQLKEATRLSLENQVNNNKGKNECGACSIL